MDEPLRVGVMVGSLRRAAYSGMIARSLPELAPERMEIALLPSIGALPHFDQDILNETGVPAPVEALAAAIRACDGLTIASPEYNWSIPGVLKNALDWLSRLKPMPLTGMPALIVTASPGLLGGARAHPPIRNVLHALDCRILARPEIQITNCASRIDATVPRISDPDTAAFVAARLADFDAFIRDGCALRSAAEH